MRQDSETRAPGDPEKPDTAAGRFRPLRLLNQVKAFNYVTVDGAPTYQAIIQVFYEAKQHYRIELRPREVLARLEDTGFHHEAADEEKLEYYLGQLVAWGNLSRGHDTTSVSRIEDFYRKRYVFHLSATGEVAHRAVREVEETVGRSGSLQANMLFKIRDALNGMARAGPRGDADPEELVRHLHDLHGSFDTLTREATRFMGDLDRHVGPGRMEEARFVLYKQAVLTYIGRFVEQLRRLAPEICAGIEGIERQGVRDLLDLAATSADLPPGLEGENPRGRWVADRMQRWEGIRAWFIGEQTWREPTVERLAGLAVNAVVGLTRTLGRLNDSRIRPVDRRADFRTLASWFAGCKEDADAHRLWQSAFGAYPSRHFHLAEEDEDLASPSISWWDCDPVSVPVRLRTRGSLSSSGRPAPVADLTRQKQWIARRRLQERARREQAMERFAGRGPLRLAELSPLDRAQFDLLLELLGEVMSAPRNMSGVRETLTLDGRYRILLTASDRAGTVSIRTPDGMLRMRDRRITVEDASERTAEKAG